MLEPVFALLRSGAHAVNAEQGFSDGTGKSPDAIEQGIACPDCSTVQDIPPLPRGSTALCVTCGGRLGSTAGRSADAALACSLSMFLLLVPANSLPLLEVTWFGQQSEISIWGAVAQLWHQGWVLLAGLSAAFAAVLPFLRFGLLSAVLGALRADRRPPWLGRAFRWAVWLDRWAMLDVFLLAGCTGYYYLAVIERIKVSLGVGGVCLVAAGILTVLSRATLDERTVWRAIGGERGGLSPHEQPMSCRTCDLVQPLSREGEPCRRCGARLFARKRDAGIYTAALLTTSFVLLFPANICPMNISNMFGQDVDYTNFSYVEQLWGLGLWPLGVLTFWTAMLSPGLMILALAWCVLSVWRRSGSRLVLKTKLFRLVAEAARWSLSGPFSIVLFVPLFDFGLLGSEAAGWGATAFAVMVVMTMLAALAFDPRLMWDISETAPQ